MHRPNPASAENGRLSQGPKTQAGKDRSRFNAVVHGLTAKKIVLLENESEEKFEILEYRYQQQLEPEGPVEEFMVDDLVADDWRIRRARGLEATMMNKAVA